MPKRVNLWLFFVVFALACFTISRIQSPIASSAIQYGIDLKKIKDELNLLASESRSPGTPGHAFTRQYLKKVLQDEGCLFESQDQWGGLSIAKNFIQIGYAHNILCRIPGTKSTGAILFVSHYDSVVNSLGASDNMAAVVTNLNVIRELKKTPAQNDFIFLFSDLEENGLNGAVAFATQHPWMNDIELVINFEARGSSGPSALFQSTERSSAVIEALSENAQDLIGSSFTNPLLQIMPNDTELSIFRDFGKIGINFAYADSLQHYHSRKDSPDTISDESLLHHNINALSTFKAFKDADLKKLDRGESNIYFDFWRYKLLYFPYWSVLLLLIVSAFFINYLRRHYRIGKKKLLVSTSVLGAKLLFWAFVISLISIVVQALSEATLIAENNKLLFLAYLSIFTIFFSRSYFSNHTPQYKRVCFYSLAFFLATLFYIKAPQLSYFLAFPLFFILCLEALISRKVLNFYFSLLIGSLCFFPCAVIVPYVVYSLVVADGGNTPAVPILFASFFVMFTHILWTQASDVQKGLGKILLFCFSFAAFSYIVLFTEFSKDNPKMHSLNYAYQTNGRSYQWLHWGDQPRNDSWLAQFFQDDYEVKEEYSLFSPYAGYKMSQSFAPKVQHLKAPQLKLLSKNISEEKIEWKFRYRSISKSPCTRFWIKNGVPVESTQFKGGEILPLVKISPSFDQSLWGSKLGLNDEITWQLRYCGAHEKALEFEIVTTKTKELVIQVVESTPGLPKFPDFNYKRPTDANVIPHQHSDQTLISKFFKF